VIRHIALFRWKPGVTPDQVAEVGRALARMPSTVDAIRHYEHGPDQGFGTPRWDYAVVAEFDDEAGWRAYAEHPEHDQILREVLAPLAEERASVQLEV
jgi:Ser/Thr protein kinase RdoA (MazF antagonist)